MHVREGGDGVVDLLDESMIRNLRVGKARGRPQDDDSSDDDEVQYTAQGKIMVKDDLLDDEAEARARKKRSAVEMMHVSDEDEDFDDGEGDGAAGQKRSKRSDGSAGRAGDAQGRGKKAGNKVRIPHIPRSLGVLSALGMHGPGGVLISSVLLCRGAGSWRGV